MEVLLVFSILVWAWFEVHILYLSALPLPLPACIHLATRLLNDFERKPVCTIAIAGTAGACEPWYEAFIIFRTTCSLWSHGVRICVMVWSPPYRSVCGGSVILDERKIIFRNANVVRSVLLRLTITLLHCRRLPLWNPLFERYHQIITRDWNQYRFFLLLLLSSFK